MARGRYIAAGSTVGTGPFIELPMLVDQYGRALVNLDTLIAGERNPLSATNSYLATFTPASWTRLLSGTSAVAIANSAAANDTMLLSVTILKNAGPATATIVGFQDQTGSAQSILLSGSTSIDTTYYFPNAMINDKSALTITPSVTLTVLVSANPV